MWMQIQNAFEECINKSVKDYEIVWKSEKLWKTTKDWQMPLPSARANIFGWPKLSNSYTKMKDQKILASQIGRADGIGKRVTRALYE